MGNRQEAWAEVVRIYGRVLQPLDRLFEGPDRLLYGYWFEEMDDLYGDPEKLKARDPQQKDSGSEN